MNLAQSVLLRWWFLFWGKILGASVLQYFGLFGKLWLVDPTHISVIALGIFVVLTLFIGWLTWRLSKGDTDKKRFVEPSWFFSESLMAIGMVGTLVGFMMMLGALIGIDVSDAIAIKGAIIKMAAGISTAVSSTLVGLSTSQLAKLQMINLGTLFKDEE
jgi:hypothetical protein